jgi:hypothetical protein
VAGDRSVEQPNSLADVIRYAVGADDSNVLLAKVEIGCEPFTPEQVAKTVAALKEPNYEIESITRLGTNSQLANASDPKTARPFIAK